MPNIQISEIVGTRIRYRLAGTAIVQAYGEELAGKYSTKSLRGKAGSSKTTTA